MDNLRWPISFYDFAHNLVRLGTKQATWVPAYITRSLYREWRDWLIDQGLARWINEDCHSLGWSVIATYETIRFTWITENF